ncbi:hypothetical protein [Bacillus sp. CGMCC 1.16541]|uniref:hypothetical protein n=1 Tax=Bacillus sp. CGMCC 1.16541 TaxID=2185143 RepID=UPI000D7321E1|nr:hypothetical protein [Bacillus sp. CGMCC 1.16541]
MFKQLFKKTTPEEKFWKWFEKNAHKYYELDERKYEPLLFNLGLHLSKVHMDLTFELSVDLIDGKREFIISADGMLDAFPHVIQLVEEAPPLPHFDIIAFRQRHPDDYEVKHGDIALTVDDMYFHSTNGAEEETIDLTVYIKGYTEEEEGYIGTAFLMLDSLLGEYDVATRLGEIDFQPYKSQLNARPIKELRDLVDSLK